MENFPVEWQLEKYFYSGLSDPQRKKDFEDYKQQCESFIKKYKGKIGIIKTDQEFFEFLEECDVLDNLMTKYGMYLGFLSSLDTQNQIIQKEDAKLNKFLSDNYESFLFVEEEYKQIGYEALMKFSESELLKPYKNSIIESANDLKYQLSEAEERVYIKLSSGNNLFEELVTSFEFLFRGKKKSEDEIRTLRENADRDIRKEAFQILANMYLNKQNQITFGNLYSAVCKSNIADIELRKYPTVISQRNISEQVSDEAVESLLTNTTNAYSLYHKFLEKKRQLLKLDKMKVYDVFAPVNFFGDDAEDSIFTFEEGWKLYKDAIKDVDPLLSEYSDKMLYEGRISVYPKPGKTSGAYANYAQTIPSFVLLNWANSRGDVTTLAHELGHAFHGELSKIQKDAVYSTPLTLAETASIFNETLMFEALLESLQDDNEKKELILSRLDDIFGTIFRQVTYVSFEKKCHESFLRNEPLTFDDYNAMWLEEMKKLYGPDVEINEDMIKAGWSMIPHIFHTPFYCYTYAFGNIISLNIYENYKNAEDKKEFIAKYHKLLSAGGSDTPENLLNNIFGIKFDETFYSTAFSHIEKLINKL
jgi:oligoendopeptidase F